MTVLIRPATTADVPTIYQLLRDYADDGQLLARSVDEISERLRGFVVAENDGVIRGCGSLEIFSQELLVWYQRYQLTASMLLKL